MSIYVFSRACVRAAARLHAPLVVGVLGRVGRSSGAWPHAGTAVPAGGSPPARTSETEKPRAMFRDAAVLQIDALPTWEEEQGKHRSARSDQYYALNREPPVATPMVRGLQDPGGGVVSRP